MRCSLPTNMCPGWPLMGYAFSPFTSTEEWHDQTTEWRIVEICSIFSFCITQGLIYCPVVFVLLLEYFLLFLGAYRWPAEKGHDFSLCSDLQHVQGSTDATIPATFNASVDPNIIIEGSCLVLSGAQTWSLWRDLEAAQELPPHQRGLFYTPLGARQQVWPFIQEC